MPTTASDSSTTLEGWRILLAYVWLCCIQTVIIWSWSDVWTYFLLIIFSWFILPLFPLRFKACAGLIGVARGQPLSPWVPSSMQSFWSTSIFKFPFWSNCTICTINKDVLDPWLPLKLLLFSVLHFQNLTSAADPSNSKRWLSNFPNSKISEIRIWFQFFVGSGFFAKFLNSFWSCCSESFMKETSTPDGKSTLHPWPTLKTKLIFWSKNLF